MCVGCRKIWYKVVGFEDLHKTRQVNSLSCAIFPTFASSCLIPHPGGGCVLHPRTTEQAPDYLLGEIDPVFECLGQKTSSGLSLTCLLVVIRALKRQLTSLNLSVAGL